MEKLTPTQVLMSLPNEPDGYTYEVEQVSSLVIKVWLVHPDIYTYTTEKVKTIYCFVKGDKVHPPKNSQHMKPKSVARITEAFRLSSFSTIVPDLTQLPIPD